MRIITCASYYGTGSSAITNLISEFDSVFSLGEEEFRFLQDPDGVADLEYNLVENFNRHNSGHALKRFRRLVDLNSATLFGSKYESVFKGKWKEKAYQYIDDLVDFSYHGWWQYDLIDKGKCFYFRKRVLNKLLHLTLWRNKPERTLNTMKKEVTYCSHPTEEEFLSKTRTFVDELFGSVSKKDIVMVDQLVPPTNIARYLRYVNDLQVVVVDRDPRDLFVLEKYFWQDGIIPADVEEFCKWFKYTREHRKTEKHDTAKVKFVQFEDLIYRYEKTTAELIRWLELDDNDHSRRRQIFNPSVSIGNTQVWKKINMDPAEIEKIEKELKEYLYDFPE